MPLAEALPNAPALAVNQGRNSETSSTTDAAPAIRSAWESRAASKLNPCIAALDPLLPTGDVLAGLAGPPLTGAPHRAHRADPSATWLPHCPQNICSSRSPAAPTVT